MCTLTLLNKLVDSYPIVALHSRYVKRGSEELPPRRTELRRHIYSPLDVASGGTWIGMNDAGLLTAVTDQVTAWVPNPERSRGLLVFDVLEGFSDTASAKDYLSRPETRRGYRRGNFVILDQESAWHVVWDRGIVVREIEAGAYALTNLTMLPDIEWTEHVERVWRRVERRRLRVLELAKRLNTSDPEGVLRGLMSVASDHGGEKGTGSICYHDPSGENLQSSSTLIAVASPVPSSRIYYCAGNPCEGEFREYSHIFCR